MSTLSGPASFSISSRQLHPRLPRQLVVRCPAACGSAARTARSRPAETARCRAACRPATGSGRRPPGTAGTTSQRQPRPSRRPRRPKAALRRGRTRPCAGRPACCVAVVLEQSRRDSTGTSVLDSRYDVIMAKPTASDSGTNSDRTGSSMMKAGMNTDRMHSMASRRGTAVSHAAALDGPGQGRRVLHLHVDVLDRHGRLIHQDADGQGQAAQRHDVDRVARSATGRTASRAGPAGC